MSGESHKPENRKKDYEKTDVEETDIEITDNIKVINVICIVCGINHIVQFIYIHAPSVNYPLITHEVTVRT